MVLIDTQPATNVFQVYYAICEDIDIMSRIEDQIKFSSFIFELITQLF